MLEDSSWGFVGGDMIGSWGVLFRVWGDMVVFETLFARGLVEYSTPSFSCIRRGPLGDSLV